MTLLWGKVLHSTFFSNPWLWLGASDSPLRKSIAQYFFLKSLTLTWREWLSSEEKYCTVLFSQIPDSDLARVTLFKATVLHSTFFSKRRLRLGAVTLLWGKVQHSTFFSNPWLWLGASDSPLRKSTAQYFFLKSLTLTWRSDSPLRKSIAQYFFLKSLTLTWREWLSSEEKYCTVLFISNPWLWLGASDSIQSHSTAQYFFLKTVTSKTWRSDSPLRKSTAQYFFLKSLTLTWREWLYSKPQYCTVLFSQNGV